MQYPEPDIKVDLSDAEARRRSVNRSVNAPRRELLRTERHDRHAPFAFHGHMRGGENQNG